MSCERLRLVPVMAAWFPNKAQAYTILLYYTLRYSRCNFLANRSRPCTAKGSPLPRYQPYRWEGSDDVCSQASTCVWVCVLSCNAVAVISYHLSESQTPAWAAGPALREGSEHLTHRPEALASSKAMGRWRPSEPWCSRYLHRNRTCAQESWLGYSESLALTFHGRVVGPEITEALSSRTIWTGLWW